MFIRLNEKLFLVLCKQTECMNKRLLLSVFFFFALLISVYSQKAKITGKVISATTGEPLIGASISILGTKKNVQSDQNGTYSFFGLQKGNFTIVCTYVSHTKKTIPDILLNESDVLNLDIVMEKASDMSSVVVKSSSGGLNRPKESVSSLLIAQKNSASVSDGISAETIKRTPDKNTGDILKRVSGASLQEDKFAIIRGLNDRYNAAYLNGAPLPSSESDRKAFAFDIFPANMLDNLVIYKTATPDMPGEFAGGQIVITTKGIPAENFQSISASIGYNNISTFKTRKGYDGSRWNFIGIDSRRKLPQDFPSMDNFKSMKLSERIIATQKFSPKNWDTFDEFTLPNTSFQYTLGRNYQRHEKDFFGMLLSASYNNTYTQNDISRIFYGAEYDNQAQSVYHEKVYNRQTLLGLIANFSLKLNNNHIFSLKNIYSINSEDKVTFREGQDDQINAPERFTKSTVLHFTSNKIFSSQLIGEHYLPQVKIKISWLASYSNINRDVPALRRMVYDSSAGLDSWSAKLYDINPVDNDNTAGLTFYSSNIEKVYNAKMDVSIPTIEQSNFKIGGYYQNRDRIFTPRLLAFCNYNSSTFDLNLLSLTPDVIFDNIGSVGKGKTGFVLKDITEMRDAYTASTNLFSYYGMMDQRYKSIRLIYGARVEQFQQKLNADYNKFTPVRINTSQTDILPSINFVYSINNKQNLRLSYSKTINRPEFRELAPFLFRDYTIKYSVFGDTSLRRASIDNFDFRYEIFPGKSQIISFSIFNKNFTDPIELISVTNQEKTLSYRNTPSANISGYEFDFRVNIGQILSLPTKSILSKIIIFGNYADVYSKVNLKVEDTTNFYYKKGRVMQGQSPYVINAGLTYQDDDNNFSSTVSLNKYGQRIFLASNGDALQNGQLIEPNLWENGRTQIDLQFSKSFPSKKLDLKLTIKDILAQDLIFFEDTNSNNKYDTGIDAVRSSATYGTVINFSLSFKF